MRLLGLLFGTAAGVLFIYWGAYQSVETPSYIFSVCTTTFALSLLLVDVVIKKNIFVFGAIASIIGIVCTVPDMAENAIPFMLACIYVTFVLVDWMEHSSWYIEMQKNGDLFEGGELD